MFGGIRFQEVAAPLNLHVHDRRVSLPAVRRSSSDATAMLDIARRMERVETQINIRAESFG
jgi:hypothetical protein